MTAKRKVIEILGPPGAGKSMLVTTLRGLSQEVVLVRTYFGFRTLPHWLRAGAKVFPLLVLGQPNGGRAIKGRALMIRLEASSSILKHARSRASVLVFDQGPIYTMARLREVRPRTDAGRWERWWKETVSTWAELLDVVVVLDARDEDLLNRIWGRPKKHTIEECSKSGARDRLNAHRLLYENLVRELKAHGDVRVIRLDTSLVPVDEVAAEAMAALGLESAAR